MLDGIDKKILEILQSDGQISNQALAEKVALSPSPCSRRVKLLEEEGYINQYVARLNPEKLGLHLTIIVLVGLDTHDPEKIKGFEEIIKFLPEVVECYLIAGQSADYMLKVVSPNLEEYQSFLLDQLTRIDGVSNVHSSFVLSSVVNTMALPLDYLK